MLDVLWWTAVIASLGIAGVFAFAVFLFFFTGVYVMALAIRDWFRE